MIKSIIQTIGTQIVSNDDGSVLGLVKSVIFNPDTGKIEALWVKTLNPELKNPVLLSDSILDWKKNIYINDDREFAEADDIIRISEIFDRDAFYIGNSVVDESHNKLGSVSDISFDTEKMYLQSVYAEKSILGIFRYGLRIFSYDSIIQALPDGIIVKNTDDIKVSVKEGIADKNQPVMDV